MASPMKTRASFDVVKEVAKRVLGSWSDDNEGLTLERLVHRGKSAEGTMSAPISVP
jgi:hypothetical protein